MHVCVQPDRHPVNAERADWLVKLDLPLLEVKSLRLELVCDVGRRHRTEQLAFLANTRRESERHLLELRGELGRGATALFLRLLETLALLLDSTPVTGSCLVCKAARKEIIA